jgi:ABC-type sugar transport system substrate-binding protein
VFAEQLPDAEIVLVQDPGSEAGDGNEFAENLLLRYPDVNVVCSISDDRALEVFESFKAANHVGDDVAIFGCDCNGQALNYIKEGTAYRGSADTGNYGQEIVNILPALLAGDESIGTQTVCTGVGVTIDNVDDYLN